MYFTNELHKPRFQHDMAYGDFKDLPRKTTSGKYYKINHVILLKNKNLMNIREVLHTKEK